MQIDFVFNKLSLNSLFLVSDLSSSFLLPFQLHFMQRAFVIGLIAALLAGIVGSFLMLQRLTLLSDAISHSVLPGLAIAFSFGIPLIFGALLASIISVIIINWIRTESRLKEDTAIGIVFASFFGLGILLISVIQKENKVDLNHFLFGNILGITSEDLQNTSIILAIILLFFISCYRQLKCYTFDPIMAQTIGLPINFLQSTFLILVALTIIVSMKAIGVILVLALLVTPGATGLLLGKSLEYVILISSIIGVSCSFSGMLLSYLFNIPPGPTIVLITSLIFFVLFLIINKKESITDSTKLN